MENWRLNRPEQIQPCYLYKPKNQFLSGKFSPYKITRTMILNPLQNAIFQFTRKIKRRRPVGLAVKRKSFGARHGENVAL